VTGRLKSKECLLGVYAIEMETVLRALQELVMTAIGKLEASAEPLKERHDRLDSITWCK
jgi:hypothetical protein